MSLLIRGMEMPKTCHCCRMCVQVSGGDIDWHWECCLLCEKVARYATDRIPDCPLIPVPPHGRLIDADAFLALINDSTILSDFLKCIINPLIRGEPTVIEAEEGE